VADNVKFTKSVILGWYGHVERMQTRGMPKQIATATVEGTRKTAIPRKRWRNEFEQDSSITRTKKRQKMATDRRKGAGVHK
jgi:hypothetical protein